MLSSACTICVHGCCMWDVSFKFDWQDKMGSRSGPLLVGVNMYMLQERAVASVELPAGHPELQSSFKHESFVHSIIK